jgi:outer membrane biosynthesis protein TonB
MVGYPLPMSRNRPPDSSRWAQRTSARKIDTPVLVVAALIAFFASLFATLLLLRPEASDPTQPMRAGSGSAQSAPRVNTPSVSAQPVDAPPVSAPPPSAQPANAPPSEPIVRAEPKPEPKPDPKIQIQLEQLGIKCAEDTNCYPD